jgi:hypothetical protein
MTSQQSAEDSRLEPMRVVIFVLLAHEHDVGVREIGEHGFEVRERLSPRIEHPLWNVRGNRLCCR